MDQFEQFFKDRRIALDTEELSPLGKRKLEKVYELRHKRKRKRNQIWLAAASIALIISIGSLFFLKNDPATPHSTPPLSKGLFEEVAPELVQQEQVFIAEIDKMVDHIRSQSVPVEYEYLFNDFTTQVKLIDKQYEMYRSELDKNGTTDELTQQIVYNYQLKISVLQKLQSEINKINTLIKNEKNDFKKKQLNI